MRRISVSAIALLVFGPVLAAPAEAGMHYQTTTKTEASGGGQSGPRSRPDLIALARPLLKLT